MKIASGIEMLEISAEVMGRVSTIHPTLIYDENEVILVDAGYPGQLPLIRAAIEKSGIPFDKISKVILTHHDIDHIGGLSGILKELPNETLVLAHEEEKDYVEGNKTPLKVAQLEEKLNLLPDNMKAAYEKIKAAFENCWTKVDKTLSDGDELPFCGGITVIYTPGHTLGHICLYVKQSKILIAGDMFFVEDGKLVKAADSINYDTDLSKKSLQKLTQYDIETVICYHGGIFNDNVNRRIAELALEK